MTNDDGTEATADSPENVEALDYVKELLDDGVAAYSTDLGAGWGGEAFGKQLAAMTIEGNWIAGAMTADYPDIKYTVAELPAGPGRARARSRSPTAGASRPTAPTRTDARRPRRVPDHEDQQLAFASLRRDAVRSSRRPSSTQKDHPNSRAFLAGADYAQNPPTAAGRRRRDRRLQRPARGR